MDEDFEFDECDEDHEKEYEENIDLSITEHVDPCVNISRMCMKTHEFCIIHIDIDCFYAQVEMNRNPELRHKPMGVQQKNLVVTTNYAARAIGVPKSCWIRDARKVCPELILVNGEDLYKYRKISQSIFDLLKTYDCPVEKLGMDENFLDVTKLVKQRIENEYIPSHARGHCYQNTSETTCHCGCDTMLKIGSIIAQEIREKLCSELSITSSAGIAHNKLLAKMIGSRHKPNDQTTIFPKDVAQFMSEIKEVKGIPGIGSTMSKTLKENGIVLVENLQNTPISKLTEFFDPVVAKRIFESSLGIDHSTVQASVASKSIGLEDRFKQISTKEECVKKLDWLLGRLSILVCEDGRLPRVLKVTTRDFYKDKNIKKFHKESRQCKVNPNLFQSLTRSLELNHSNHKLILDISLELLKKMVAMDTHFHLTLIGLSVSNFISRNDKRSISTFFKKSPKSLKYIMDDTKPPSTEVACSVDLSSNANNMQTTDISDISQVADSTEKKILKSPPKNIETYFSSTKMHPLINQRKRMMTNSADDLNVSQMKRTKVSRNEHNRFYDTPIDPDVLKELPESIQQEILLQYKNRESFIPVVSKTLSNHERKSDQLKDSTWKDNENIFSQPLDYLHCNRGSTSTNPMSDLLISTSGVTVSERYPTELTRPNDVDVIQSNIVSTGQSSINASNAQSSMETVCSNVKLNADHLESSHIDRSQNCFLPKGWDPDVFNQLPSDMRDELLRHQNSTPTSSNQSKTLMNHNNRKGNIKTYFSKK